MRDSFLERDTYWDEEEDQTYDWDSAEEEEEPVDETGDEEEDLSDAAWVEYEALEEDADGIFEPAEGADAEDAGAGVYEAEEEPELYESVEDDSCETEEADAFEPDADEGEASAVDVSENAGIYDSDEFFGAGEPDAEAEAYESEEMAEEEADIYVLEEGADACIPDEESGFCEPHIRNDNEIAAVFSENEDYAEPEDTMGYFGGDDPEIAAHREAYYEAEDAAGEYDDRQEAFEEEADYDEAAWPDDFADAYDTRRSSGKTAPRAVRSAGGRKQARTAKSSAGRKPPARRRESFLEKIGGMIHSMETMDKVMVVTGVAVLVMAIVTGGVFIHINTAKRQISGFTEVGRQLEGISLIGERGLLAVANMQLVRFGDTSPAPEEEEPSREYDEAGYARDVSVEPNFTSIQKDLKIKFINRNTDKLVGNVPFSVTVTDPDGKNAIWSDDDMDGIIYKKDITPGTYQVAMEPLADEKYAGYTLFTDTQRVEVKKEIVYEKVDVANEVKKESEVNVAQEDTRKNETVVESTLKDTVTWVESKVISATYNEVARSTIPDPATLVARQRSLYLSAEESGAVPVTEEGGVVPDASATEPAIPEDPATQTEAPATEEPVAPPPSTEDPALPPPVTEAPVAPPSTEEPEPPVTSTEEPEPPVTSTEEPEPPATPTEEPVQPSEPAPTPAVPPVTSAPEQPPLTPTPPPAATTAPQDPGPTLAKGTVSVTPSALNAAVGNTLTAKATAVGFTGGYKIVYAVSSSNAGVASATVDANGNINISAAAAGNATITVTANYENGAADTQATAFIGINVTGNAAITLDKTNLTVYAEVPVAINAKVTNGAASPVLTAESSDRGIATVSVDGTAITITGVAEGTANITVKYNSGSQELSAVCAVTVKKHPREDNVTLLKDADGQQLYVLEGTAYREAVRADYYTADKFFIKGDARYSGWQTLEGRVYYFNADGSKVTGEQVIQGAKYNFASDGSLVTGSGTMGIDVSKWNGKIDWNAVKNSGVSYVIIRCGYRGSAQGSLIEDPRFETNIQGAIAAGLKVGVYFFSQAVDEMEAVEEASMVLDQIRNYRISYPVFLDVEASGGRADSIDKATRTAVCKAFCQTIQNGGYTAGIYANKTWLESKIDTGSLSAYKIWLAQYAASPTYKGRYDLWQYRSTGSVSGISGNVDFNISYLGY